MFSCVPLPNGEFECVYSEIQAREKYLNFKEKHQYIMRLENFRPKFDVSVENPINPSITWLERQVTPLKTNERPDINFHRLHVSSETQG